MTGRPVTRAPNAASVTWGQTRSAEPKAPPTNGEWTRTSSDGMSKTPAISAATLTDAVVLQRMLPAIDLAMSAA